MHQTHPELSILVQDLKRNDLHDRLITVREFLRQELKPIIEGEFLEEDRDLKDHQVELLYDENFLDYLVDKYHEVARIARIVNPSYFGEVILQKPGIAVIEASHGVLTDRICGFHPHTSAIRTLPHFTRDLLKEAGFNGQIVNLGVTRAYAIRHGAGPLPTADSEMTDRLLPGSHKQDNRWQGKVRVGPMDLVLLRYAIQVCGGPEKFDGLAISCFDQVVNDGHWSLCEQYCQGNEDPIFFTKDGQVVVYPNSDEDHYNHQAGLTQKLFNCVPQITQIPVDSSADRQDLYQLCASVIHQSLGIPVRMVSFGPTELDKICK
jgi:adenylosuccinate synthase